MIKYVATALFVTFATPAFSLSDNPNVVERCERSDRCALLQNEVPDYNFFEAEVVEVIDADSMTLKVHLWPGMIATYNVRSRGVDAPSIEGRAKCDAEREAGERAKRSIERKYPVGSWVLVANLSHGKFAERVVADIMRWRSDRFISVADELLENENWGRAYSGTGPRSDWCS